MKNFKNKLPLIAIFTIIAIYIAYNETSKQQTQHFEEINVERINVIEKDGTIRLALFNEEKMPMPVINGVATTRSIQGAGLIIYNPDGDERGGMVVYRKDSIDLEVSGLAYDYQNSEGISFGRYEKGKEHFGCFIGFNERLPLNANIEEVGSVGKTRLDIGIDEKKSAIRLNDSKGNLRILISVDSLDSPSIKIFNEKGMVVSSI